MRRVSRFLLVWTLALGLVSPGTAATVNATAAAADLTLWEGRAVAVNDGDTIDVDLLPLDGVADVRVRMLGIQAMELHDYVAKTGDCHGPEAYRRLAQLVEGKDVRLSASDPNSTGLKGRVQRFVSVQIDGRWTDVGRILMSEGHALWFPHPVENSNNVAYQRAARRAQRREAGIWNPKHCAPGPQQRAKLDMVVQWDADGVDGDNVNGEWVRISNRGGNDVRLGGWVLRESALRETHSATSPLRQYTFPAGTRVPAGKSITVHVGKGRDRATRLYWGQSKPVFENVPADGNSDGDGAYLFDPDGDVRAHFMYPCLKRRCTDKNMGNLRIGKVRYDPAGVDKPNGEFIKLKVPKAAPVRKVRLEGYLLESWPYSYAFDANDVVVKGKPLTLRVGKGTERRRVKFWGFRDTILSNTGDTARVRTYDNIVLHCKDWGNATC